MFIFSFVQVSHCLHEILDQCGAFSKLLMCCESPMIPRELGQLESIAKVSRNTSPRKSTIYILAYQSGIWEGKYVSRESNLEGTIKPFVCDSWSTHWSYSMHVSQTYGILPEYGLITRVHLICYIFIIVYIILNKHVIDLLT